MKSKKMLSMLLVSIFGLSACGNNDTSSSIVNELKQYTVTWVVDGKTHVEKYEEGTLPTFKFGTAKEADNTYTYTFTGWDKNIVAVTEDVTYTAQYSQQYIDYTYTWVVGDNETQETYHYGDTPEYKEGTPTKEGDAQYTYTFSGWDKEIDSVTGDETLIAQFDRTVNQYDITFIVDGESITEKFYYGELPIYTGSLDKSADDDYIYTFSGWDKEIIPVTGPATYTAQYESTANGFIVKFIGNDGTILDTQILKLGERPEYNGETPKVKDKNNNNIDATGWLNKENGKTYETELPEVTSDVEYYAYSKDFNVVEFNTYHLDGSLVTSETKIYDFNETYTLSANDLSGYVVSHDYVKGSHLNYDSVNIYYSTEDVWNKVSTSTSLEGDGTKENPYLINSGADLAYFKNQISSGNNYSGQYIKMTKSIDVNGFNFKMGTFSGTFDGNNCAIRGLELSGASNMGLFTQINGVVKNLSIYGNLSSTGGFVGALTGTLNGRVENVTNYMNVTSNWSVAGISGLCGGSIINCSNYGDIIGTSCTGGILGESNITEDSNVVIDNNINFGTISGTWGEGGIAGNSKMITITNCSNHGDISGSGQTGGISGRSSGLIDSSINTGSVTGGEQCGGISGESSDGSGLIFNSTNYGLIQNGKNIGGIVGVFNGVKMENCINNGEVSGTNPVGGLVGKTWNSSTATFTNCINNGTIRGTSYFLGGLFGTCDVCIVTSCVNNGELISTADCVGGLAGAAYKDAKLENCTNNGDIQGTNKLAGLVYSNQGTLINCTNNGNIYLTKASGVAASDKLVYSNNGTMTNCVNNGVVVPYSN